MPVGVVTLVLVQTIPHFRRSHHSEKRRSTKTRNTNGKFHRSLVSRTVTPGDEVSGQYANGQAVELFEPAISRLTGR